MPYPRLLIVLFSFSVFCYAAFALAQKTPQQEADEAFAHHEYKTALELYSRLRDAAALSKSSESKSSDWAVYAAQVVRCHTALTDQEQAAQEYFLLCANTPPENVPLDCIPLPWFTPAASLPMGMRPPEKTALDRLDTLKFKSPGPAATLLAAAVLANSTDAGRRSRGMTLLRNLESMPLEQTEEKTDQNSTRPEQQRCVSLLASAFLWKQRIPLLRGKQDLIPLQKTLDRLPETLRAGPYFLYGLAARQAGEYDSAVLAWMRLPILFGDQRVLCVESLREASKTLDTLDRSEQATALRQEAEAWR